MTELTPKRQRFIEGFHCNHIHGIYGDWTQALTLVCRNLSIDCVVL